MKKLLLTLVLLTATSMAFAEESAPIKQPSPEQMKEVMEASFGAMVPMMGKMAEVMIEAQLKYAEKPETAQKLAKFKRNLYKQLIAEGFSKKEAFDIMLNTAAPAGMPGMK